MYKIKIKEVKSIIENSEQVSSYFIQGISSIQQMKTAIAECTSALAEFSNMSHNSSESMKNDFQNTTANVEKLQGSFTTVIDSFSEMKQLKLPAADSSEIKKLTLPYENVGKLISDIGKQTIKYPSLD